MTRRPATASGHSCKRPAERPDRNGRRARRLKAQMDTESSYRYKNILAARSVPFLFILMGFLVVANTRCDQVGSANAVEELASEHYSNTNIISNKSKNGNSAPSEQESKSAESINTKKILDVLEQQAAVALSQPHQKKQRPPTNKVDPLSLLREIYLDHDSKIITMLLPESETVQKFHPNGRYGRRSVDNFAEPHTELGRLVYNDEQSLAQAAQSGPNKEASAMRALLRSIVRNVATGQLSQRRLLSALAPAAGGPATPTGGANPPAQASGPESPFSSGVQSAAGYQLEMNKLLKCNYSGISNLFWCDATSKA